VGPDGKSRKSLLGARPWLAESSVAVRRVGKKPPHRENTVKRELKFAIKNERISIILNKIDSIV
jgi:hypothetical protein